MCGRAVKGAWPTQCSPSPPICVNDRVARSSSHTAMLWQPMPAVATLPSGTLVERLCGQPEQKVGRRTSSPAAPAAQGWTMSAGGLSRAASVSASAQPPARRRSTRMPATMSAPSSPAEGTSGRPRSSPLPVRRGRRCASTPNSSRASWSSITGRFSSTTRTSSWPAQKSRMREGSSGHGMATL